MKNRFLCLACILIANIGIMSAWDYEQVQIGTLYYNLDATNQTAEVTYQVQLSNTNYSGLITAAIPDIVAHNSITYNVTSIGDAAFRRCTGLTSVTIPNSVTNIGVHAFDGCTGLTSVTIPNSITSIGGAAFASCTGLTSITIPNSVTSIGSGAFYGCSSLTSPVYNEHVFAFMPKSYSGTYTIPDGIETICGRAFSCCDRLSNVTIPNSVSSVGPYAFEECTSLPVVNNIRYADTYLVEAVNKSLSSYSIKEGTRWIGSGAFSQTNYLRSISIPNSVISIGAQAFCGSKELTEVKLGNNVTDIETSAFQYCQKLQNITLSTNLTTIGSQAFLGDTALISITIPKSVKSIEGSAFSECTGLTSVHISDLTAWINIKFLDNPLGHARHLYLNGEEVTKVVFPEGVTEIGARVFLCCLSLTDVTIPSSVTSIGEGAFHSCDNMETITCMATTPPVCAIYTLARSDRLKRHNIYVPKESVDLYRKANAWQNHRILPIETQTNISYPVCRDDKVCKLIHNGQLFIQQGDKIYNAQGARIE